MPGLGWFPLAFVALAPWALATERAPGRLAPFAVDFLWGLVFFGVRLVWLARITWISYAPVLLVSPLFVVFAGLLYRRLRRRLPAFVALPAAWLAQDVVRSLAHFPCDALGYAAAGWLDLAGLASIAGPFGLTVLLGIANGAAADFVAGGGARRIPLVAAAVVVAAGVFAGGRLRRDTGPLVDGPLLACVQPNIPQSIKEDLVPHFDVIVESLLRLAREGADRGADVVVIPETMFPSDVLRGASPNAMFGGRAVREYLETERLGLKTFRRAMGPRPLLLTGAMLYDRVSASDETLRLRNSALLFDREDKEVARYDKRYLVPGAEEFPLVPEGAFTEWFRDALNPYVHGMVPDMVPGERIAVFELPAASGAPVGRAGIAICYDNAYSEPFREAVRQNANFHLVLSNEGWFPDSYEMDSMLAYSAFRAIETRRAVVRCTNTGISCAFDPDGTLASVLTSTGRRSEIEGVLLVRPKLGSATTLYVTIGDLPAYALAALAVLSAIALGWGRAKAPAPVHSP